MRISADRQHQIDSQPERLHELLAVVLDEHSAAVRYALDRLFPEQLTYDFLYEATRGDLEVFRQHHLPLLGAALRSDDTLQREHHDLIDMIHALVHAGHVSIAVQQLFGHTAAISTYEHFNPVGIPHLISPTIEGLLEHPHWQDRALPLPPALPFAQLESAADAPFNDAERKQHLTEVKTFLRTAQVIRYLQGPQLERARDSLERSLHRFDARGAHFDLLESVWTEVDRTARVLLLFVERGALALGERALGGNGLVRSAGELPL